MAFFKALASLSSVMSEESAVKGPTGRDDSAGMNDNKIDHGSNGDNANGVRVVQLHEWKAAALCLAQAFAKDDVVWYCLNTPDRDGWTYQQKWDLHVKIMEYLTYAHLLKGTVLTAGPNYDCVALCMPPGSDMDDLMTTIRSGLWRLSFELSAEGRTRFFSEFLPLMHITKTEVLAERDHDSWYLVYLGTQPSGRGKGYARKILEHISRQADARGQACYLESSNPVNLGFYGKLGYVVRKHIYLQRAKENVQMDVMVREPVKAEKE